MKLLGSPKYSNVTYQELADWEVCQGLEPTSADAFGSDPVHALARLDALGVTAHLLPWFEDMSKTVCVFQDLAGQLRVTEPQTSEAWAAAIALHFVACPNTSAVT